MIHWWSTCAKGVHRFSTSSFCGTCTFMWTRNSIFLCTAEFIGCNMSVSNWNKKSADKFVNFNLWIPKAHRSLVAESPLTSAFITSKSSRNQKVVIKKKQMKLQRIQIPGRRNTRRRRISPVIGLIHCDPMRIQCFKTAAPDWLMGNRLCIS